MENATEQYEKIKDTLPIQRGNVKARNLELPTQFCMWLSKAANGEVFRPGLAGSTAFIRA
jgi:hypothetical protein